MSSSTIPVVFKKSIYKNLTYVLIETLSCHLHSCTRYVRYQKNKVFYAEITEAAVGRCSVKKVFLEISRNAQENTSAPATLLKKKLWDGCFPVNFAKFLRTSFLQNTSGRLLLKRHLKVGAKIYLSLGNTSKKFYQNNLTDSKQGPHQTKSITKFNNRNNRKRCAICSKLDKDTRTTSMNFIDLK